MRLPFLVDCHSHVVPSSDDGAQSIADAVGLCRDAARHGTAILFATPHVWAHLPLSEKREEQVRAAFEQVRAVVPLELRLGFELTPSRHLLKEDPARYELKGTGRVLMELPFVGPHDLVVDLAEHVEAAGFKPVLAHPERVESVQDRPGVAAELGERWPLQVNGSSLLGRHGGLAASIGWDLVERGLARVVASDGHRTGRPARLDEAWTAACERIGEERALPLFDGSALGLAAPEVERRVGGARS
jgi:protein-tyrosine phosphatase